MGNHWAVLKAYSALRKITWATIVKGWKEACLPAREPTSFMCWLLVFILVFHLKSPSWKVERVPWRLRVRVWIATWLTRIARPGEMPPVPAALLSRAPILFSSARVRESTAFSVPDFCPQQGEWSIFSDVATSLPVALLLLALSTAFWNMLTSTGCCTLEESSWTRSNGCCYPLGLGVWVFVFVQSCLSNHLHSFKVNQMWSLPSGFGYCNGLKPVALFP